VAPELRSLRQHSVLLASSLATPPATDDPTCPRLSVMASHGQRPPRGTDPTQSLATCTTRAAAAATARPVRAPAGGASTTGDRLHPLVRLSRASDTQLPRQCWGCRRGGRPAGEAPWQQGAR